MELNEAVMESTQALPAGLLYSLLTALDPKTLLKGESRPPRGAKTDPAAKQDFEEAVKAAAKAGSAAEFARMIGATATQEGKRHGPITALLVYNTDDGGVFIRVMYADGVTFDSYYPPGTY
jgi:hypothetical protein